MQFDPTISIGVVVNIASTIIIALVLLVGMHWRLRAVEVKQDKLDSKLDRQTEILERMARYEERLKALDSNVDDLKHGRGFVFESGFGGGTFPSR